jgi:tetratricopeptide (TPR) repeat protein
VTAQQRTFGARLRELRLQRALTQRDLAEPEYNHAYVSMIEAGRRRPSPTALRQFADRLGIDPDDLASGRPPGLVRDLDAALSKARVAVSDGGLEEAEALLVTTEALARRHRVARARARAHELRGLILERAGEREAALDQYEAAERLLKDEPVALHVDAVAGKARCLQALGDLRYANFVLERLRRSLGRDAPADSQAHAAAALLSAYLDAGLVRLAEDAASDLERLRPRTHDPLRRGQIDLYLARLRATQGRIKEADALLASAAEFYAASGLLTERGYAHLARGYLLSRTRRLSAAVRELEEARRIFEQTRNQKELCNTLIELARVERIRGRVEASAGLLEDVMTRLDDGEPEVLAWAHREYGLLHRDGDHGVAEKHLRTAIDLFDRGEPRLETAITYRMLGDVLREQGQREAAQEAYAMGIRRLPDQPA